jgi:hypothetical protein
MNPLLLFLESRLLNIDIILRAHIKPASVNKEGRERRRQDLIFQLISPIEEDHSPS